MVFDVIFSSNLLQSMFQLDGSISTKTGLPPAWIIEFTVAQKVIAVVITSSPGFKSSVKHDKCNPAVQELRARENFEDLYFAKSSSNLFVLGPVPNQPFLRESITSLISSFPILGWPNNINSWVP